MFDYSINLRLVRPPGLDDGSEGRAQVRLDALYLGNPAGSPQPPADFREVKVFLYSSTDNQFGADDQLLEERTVLFPVSYAPTVRTINFDTENGALAQASYYLIARVAGQAGGEAPQNLADNQSMALVNADGADPILVWTSCALNAIKSAGSNGKPGVPPTTGTRLMAMLSTAMLDTLAAFTQQVDPYRIDVNAPTGANRNAALAGAAHRILSRELPGEAALIQDQFNRSLQSLQGSSASIQAGLAFGADVADQIRALRANDGSSNDAPYTPPDGLPGYVWMPATSGPTANVALGANWGSVTPWVISGTEAFRSDGLQCRPDVNLELYAEQLNEVRLYGGLANTAQTTLLRSPEQTEIALFWAYDRPDTFRPYGQLLDIAMDVAAQEETCLTTNAQLIASLSLAMADSVICAWKEKYTVVQPRPWDLITGSFSDTDGSALTVRDTAWRTLLSSINGIESPPFPDFLSGHSTMGGSFASVMSHFFGDDVTFSATSQELPGIVRTFDGTTDANGVARNSFYEAGMEDAISRIYGGVHVREACLDSFSVGLNVGAAVVQTLWS
ncbi:MAG: phosphatase PAP2 family protein [Cyanobacteriota bacterium]|nr:phosphatase PAP2 family protein [Cyanobacteriota bacterium]